jgi:hypothetical protein
MINSTSSSDRTVRPDSVPPIPPKAVVRGVGSDQFSAENSAALRSALAAQPEIRPDVVARGRTLAADPSYPSPEILRKVGEAILKAPDLSVDHT